MTAAIALVLALAVSITANVMLVLRRKVNQNRSVRTAILSGIQNVSELATIRERFQSIITFSDGIKIPGLNINIPGTTKKFMLKYYGTIVCGCDLSKAKVSERFDINRVRITLPHSEILDIYADVHSFEVYDQRAGIFTSVKLEDQNREVNSDLNKVKAHELEKGILAHSDDNVRKILSSVVASVGMEAEIVFTENDIHELGVRDEVLQLEAVTEQI
ncbi:MAG: DUF4230 domain-containing protein [Synergistaceae bacterium]|nr:DUF4230 domain-containing protein [Synergistaceae bacterium]MBQ9574271.1 DUF4230 domain-containing protein [Synergistaceae bacterium]